MKKTHWSDLPQEVQDAVRLIVGGVTDIEMISEGLNSELTLAAETESGRLFFKGARLDDSGKSLQLRREISINPYVTHLSPKIRVQVEEAGWLLVGFDHVEGRRADYSPKSPDIPLVLELLDALSETPCPGIPLPYSESRRSNHARVDDLRRFAGNSLMHTDLNPGNVWIARDRAYLLDWARPTRGASWSDASALALCLITCGHIPRDAEAIVSALPVWKDLGPGDLDAAVQYMSAVRSDLVRNPIDDHWTNSAVEAARRWWDYRWSR